MFIKEVMAKIWSENYQNFMIEMNNAGRLDINELKKQCMLDIDKLNEKKFCSDNHTLTIIETMGCQHQFKNDCISGCTFCDWDSSRIPEIARMHALYDMDVDAYADVVKYSFQKIRGKNCTPSLIEQISIHDALDQKQFPIEAFDKLFGDSTTYSTKPNIGIISARASSVTYDGVMRWKNVFKRGLTIGIGIEVGNEWIRNHWLNKDITNNQIENAVKIIHKCGAKVCANIILGVSGIGAKNSLKIFWDTCRYVLSIGVDYILISPLVIKPKSLGNILRSNKVNEHYSLPVVLTDSLIGIIDRFPNDIPKFTFSPDNFEVVISMANGIERKMLESVYNLIDNMGKVYTTRKLNDFKEFDKTIINSNYYNENKELMQSEKSIIEELKSAAYILSNTLWNNEKMYNLFLKELDKFDCEDLI